MFRLNLAILLLVCILLFTYSSIYLSEKNPNNQCIERDNCRCWWLTLSQCFSQSFLNEPPSWLLNTNLFATKELGKCTQFQLCFKVPTTRDVLGQLRVSVSPILLSWLLWKHFLAVDGEPDLDLHSHDYIFLFQFLHTLQMFPAWCPHCVAG